MIFDTTSIIEVAKKFFLVLRVCYGVLIYVSMTLAFFLLLVSLTKNIQGKFQIGVLRAIGLNKKSITKIYFYEAVTSVIAEVIVGLISGGTISYMLVK